VGLALAERERAPKAAAAGADAVFALDHVVIQTPNPDRAVALYGARLGLDLRLDRTNPQWGSRLIFFRCGGAVVEIGARIGGEPSHAPDRLSGLAWRVADPDAARARIAAAGFDVSEVRTGRKPGTKVFTVRSGVPGAPTLMLSAGGDDDA
ncbi:MAG: VOC family protein, partial [Caulobacteraceae bacterium]